MESARASLDQLVANFDWISNVTHSYDFHALLRSNAPPSPLQSVDLKYSLDNMVYITQKLQAALDLLGNAVATLEAHMSRVQSLQRDYEVMLSPIRRVPVKIIIEILHCTQMAAGDPGEVHFGGYNVFTGAKGPWLLGQVCRSWRDVVSTLCPRLWASMTISISDSWRRNSNQKHTMEMLEHALERTRGHPLDFLFEDHNSLDPGERDVMDRCFNLMNACSVRWRRAGFIVPPSLLRCLSRFRGKIELLEDAYVCCRVVLGQQPSRVTGFEIAPRLKSLRLEDIDADVQFPFPTANLVSYNDERSFAGDQLNPEYVRIFKSSPKLLSFSFHDGVTTTGHIGPPSSHPRVTSRSIQALSVSSANLLCIIDVPALREVVLRPARSLPCMHLPRDVIISLSELIRHSHCSLTRLSVADVIIVGDDLMAVLRLTPCLQELSVRFNGWSKHNEPGMESLVDSLAETVLEDGPAQHSLVPFLTSLVIVLAEVGDTCISFVDPSFVAMITSRQESGALMKLVLHIEGKMCTGLGSADETDLMLLQLTGLVLDYVIKAI
ncbi:hypothetical protein ARMGADRAFT_605869 [Armillaria gallica]|uniref:F-box domain-containing protein n=1 Tax=Armillaria gallica TaxID=47427 RepID=A0A2H3CRU5_ARMGA|nr:hypothetical protein ARMGADRAFT_605869 [Armillaria gallica]